MPKRSVWLLTAALSPVLAGAAWCGYQVHTLSGIQEQVKADYSTVNNVTFGLLSVSEWRDRLEAVIDSQVGHFKLTPDQEQAVRAEVSETLSSLVTKMIAVIERPQPTVKGKIRKLAFNTFVSRKELYQLVPVFTGDIMREIKKPATRKRMSLLVHSKMEQLEEGTYDSSRDVQRRVVDSLVGRYHAGSVADFNRIARELLLRLRRTTYGYAFGLLACILVILVTWWVLRDRRDLHVTLYCLSILSAVILLLVGLTTTMIEIDARIRFLDFHLMGSDISFYNQVLFFQSKSIVQVVQILLATRKYDAVIVGLLILCFSILFPIAKLISAGIFLLGKKKWTHSGIISFFAFKSGKWSMADVMVVAILMTYIGFNGIVDNELSGLNVHSQALTSITTNHTSLQPGYIVFTGFVLYGLFLSQVLKTVIAREQRRVPQHAD